MRTRATSKAAGGADAFEASMSRPVVEMVTERAFVVSPMRMVGSFVMRSRASVAVETWPVSTRGVVCDSRRDSLEL